MKPIVKNIVIGAVLLVIIGTTCTTSTITTNGGSIGFVAAYITTTTNNNNINNRGSIIQRNSGSIVLLLRQGKQQQYTTIDQQHNTKFKNSYYGRNTIIRTTTSTTTTKLYQSASSTNNNNNEQQQQQQPVDDWEKGIPYGEISRKYRRDVFAYGDWVKHRSDNRRFISNPNDILNSGIVRQLSKECIITGSIATFIVVYNALFSVGYDDFAGIHHPPFLNLPPFIIPSIFFTLTLPALSFLLIFKTNTSYQRWDEGRKNWGSIVNNSRTILRECSAWLLTSSSSPTTMISDNDKRRCMGRLAAAVWLFPRSMTRHLLSVDEDDANYATDCRANLNNVLADDMITARHKPTRALYELSCAITAFPLGDYRRIAIDHAVTALCDAMGSNERIFTSPVPRFYTKHLNRFLQVWLVVLPFTLYPTFDDTWNHWFCIPATIIISFFLLGIEELGIQLEEPFTVLPMHKITNGIGLSAEEHLQWFLNDSSSSSSSSSSTKSTTSTTNDTK